MIGVLFQTKDLLAGQLALAALRRSVTSTQAVRTSIASLGTNKIDTVVVINATPRDCGNLRDWLAEGSRKLLLLGDMPESFASELGCVPAQWPEGSDGWSISVPAPAYGLAESAASIRYSALAHRLDGREWRRPLMRFDFTDEWNNLGYGAIRADGSAWGLGSAWQVPVQNELASLQINDVSHGSYAALFDRSTTSILWFNRAVGPIDSFEWRLVESFLSSYRHQELTCHPVLREIPWGYDAAITMRLDCDEDIESARALWNAYREMDVPFSLAVHTSNLEAEKNHGILRELIDSGGSVLSHTKTHAPNWGGNYDAAMVEGAMSADEIKQVTGITVKYAVSPFHQSPDYALAALADAGYQGCIGGIIRNDPEFNLARGGYLANLPQGFVGHSQQCMLHGESMLSEGDSLRIFKEAFDVAYETNTLFGYLDHPFSDRYQYGWQDEDSRIDAHRRFVEHIRTRASQPLFMNENDALDFLGMKSEAKVVGAAGGFSIDIPCSRNGRSDYDLAVEFKGRHMKAIHGDQFA
ncbi:polysaccharide deacetylase family protein [Actimicrobium sp. CCC2.4]|uniref:polysaccharide deacetylase family protein n=1 Tax=Actimicrobium sp. CCC2.4 TaxID=3048606 RepID=UPI002AC947CF|nr:polysaccharide deacetylase family protein [Actimicrobium sp. CCC2.4]MEB0136043.1 polysaccharide deacetylase family protein [Actimicrobium sp. CCC2.4]WPX32199.1 polysaccharide deacetylase family protein [Actimicrobium sp. CCC2.4]